ncbi:MAG: F0F1 ATP synthase subunit epsilon [Gammaproteobacteria bacterium]|nr:F0F1 ATP synthase subunit epsilon [Gammaproteobacteria bacterium]
MAMTFHVDVVSAEEEIFSGSVEMLFAPGEMGDLGIMARHSPLLTSLKPGELRLQLPNGEDQYIYVSGGMLEVQPHIVTVLSDTAVRAKDIDEAAAMEAKEKAEAALKDNKGEIDFALAESQLAEAVAQLHMLKKLKNSTHR